MNEKYQIVLFLFCASLFAFLGYWFAEKEFKKDKETWINTQRETIKEELKKEAEKNYEIYLRDHGIDSADYQHKLEWLLSNSPYR